MTDELPEIKPVRGGLKVMTEFIVIMQKWKGLGLLHGQVEKAEHPAFLYQQAKYWFKVYLKQYDLVQYNPLTHVSTWQNSAYEVFMDRKDIFERSRWHKDGPTIFKFWHKAGIAPKGYPIVRKGRRFAKVPHYKVSPAAALFTGDDPVIAARKAKALASKRRARIGAGGAITAARLREPYNPSDDR